MKRIKKRPLIELEYQEEKDGILHPNIQISQEEEADQMPLGKYGMMAMKYLKENYQSRYNWLKIEGEIENIGETTATERTNKESNEHLRNLQTQGYDKNDSRGDSSNRNSIQKEIENKEQISIFGSQYRDPFSYPDEEDEVEDLIKDEYRK